MSGGTTRGSRGSSRSKPAETASLTADLMLRGRARARELVDPALAGAARTSRPVTDLRSLVASVSRRDVALVILWASVFVGCFLLARLTG